MDKTTKDCKCGSKPRLQAFGSVYWLACKCGAKANKTNSEESAVLEWNELNRDVKPRHLKIKGSELDAVMERQKAGELYVHSMEFDGSSNYILRVSWIKNP